MFSWLKRLAAPVAALAVLAVGAVAQATPVQFYTVGYFSGTGAANSGVFAADFKQNSSLTIDADNDGNAATLSFVNSSTFYDALNVGADNGLITWPVTSGPLTVNFGQFNLSATGSGGDVEAFAGHTFTLEFHQILPIGGTSTLMQSITGSVTAADPFALSNGLQIVFSPNVAYIPDPSTGVRYTVAPSTGGLVEIAGGFSAGTPTTLQGQVAVPLPGIAWAGMTLFGMVGGANGLKRIRRRMAVGA